MNKLNTKTLLPIGTSLLSILFIYFGIVEYGIWDEKRGPLGGFFPVIISVVLLLVSVLAIVQSFKEDKVVYEKENWLPVGGMIAMIVAAYIIGMVPSVLIYLVLWLRIIEKSSWKQTLIVTGIVGTIVYGVFVLWLNIPFPQGMILDAILG